MVILQIVFIYQRLGKLAASTDGMPGSSSLDTPRHHRRLSNPNPELFKKSLAKREFSSAGNLPGSVPVQAKTWCFF